MTQTDVTFQQSSEAVDRLTKSSIELAEAASNYGALKVIFGVFMVLVIIIILIFLYQVLILSRKIDRIHTRAEAISGYIEDSANRVLGIPEAQIVLRRSLNELGTLMKYHIIWIKYENHIENLEATTYKINRVVDNAWNEMHGFLSTFTCNCYPISKVLNDEDTKLIKRLVEEIVYDSEKKLNVSAVDNQVNLLIDGFKLTYLRNLKL